MTVFKPYVTAANKKTKSISRENLSGRSVFMKPDPEHRPEKDLHLFTIVELLMVISIILILAALLLPVLKSARDKAMSIQCGNNLKQSGYSFFQYAGDFNNLIPNTWRDEYSTIITAHTAAVVGDTSYFAKARCKTPYGNFLYAKTMVCPSLSPPIRPNVKWQNSVWLYSYTQPGYYQSNVYDKMGGQSIYSSVESGYGSCHFLSLPRVKNSASAPFLFCGEMITSGSDANVNDSYSYGLSRIADAFSTSNVRDRTGMSLRHIKQGIGIMLDGHLNMQSAAGWRTGAVPVKRFVLAREAVYFN